MADYTYAQLKQLWIQNGGNPAVADIAAAIAMAESGGKSDAINHNSDGSTDRGFWQINSVHGNLSTTDPIANVKAAIQISNNGKNWTPWVTFKSGAYKKFLSPTTPAGGDVPANTSSNLIPGVGGISVSGLVKSAVDQLLKMMGLGSVTDLMERAGLIILGFAIVLLGIHLLASGSGGSQAINVNVDREEGESGTTTTRKIKTPVSQHKTTTSTGRRSVAGTGASEAVEAAAVA